MLTLAALILGGGLFPQPGVTTRERAAEEILRQCAGRGRTEPRPVPVVEHEPAVVGDSLTASRPLFSKKPFQFRARPAIST